MRILSIAAAGFLGLAGCNPAPAESAAAGGVPAESAPAETATGASPAPQAAPQERQAVAYGSTFERTDPAAATMILSREGEAWRVTFRAGGVPNGAATAADCELQAVGPQDADDVIAARLVPFEGELNTVTAADIGAKALVIQVRVGPEGVFVEDSGAAARLCGVGSDIDGFYRRTETPD